MVVLADDRSGLFYPTGANILAAMDWLVSEPGTQCFLHYSGHGGQVKDPDGDRESGLDDTVVPVDYQKNGQLDSDTLHRHLVSKLHATSTLFVVFDCCHSGSAIELPFVYRPDADGNVNLMDNVKEGLHLMQTAQHLLQGGFTQDKVTDAKQLFAGAQSFFQGLKHRGEGSTDESGLDEEKFMEDWVHEGKSAFMFSGCRDDQTSADANIGGSNVGAMSWALLETLYSRPAQSYIEVRGLCGMGILRWCADLDVGTAEHEATTDGEVQTDSPAFCGVEGRSESTSEYLRDGIQEDASSEGTREYGTRHCCAEGLVTSWYVADRDQRQQGSYHRRSDVTSSTSWLSAVNRLFSDTGRSSQSRSLAQGKSMAPTHAHEWLDSLAC